MTSKAPKNDQFLGKWEKLSWDLCCSETYHKALSIKEIGPVACYRTFPPVRPYTAKGFTAVKMRVVGRDGFSIATCLRRVQAARRGIGPEVELMVDAHGSLEVATAIKLAKELEPYN